MSGDILKRIDEVFSMEGISFKVEEKKEKVVEKTDDNFDDVKAKVEELGYKISDIDVEGDKYTVDVTKKGKTTQLYFSTSELKSIDGLISSIVKKLK